MAREDDLLYMFEGPASWIRGCVVAISYQARDRPCIKSQIWDRWLFLLIRFFRVTQRLVLRSPFPIGSWSGTVSHLCSAASGCDMMHDSRLRICGSCPVDDETIDSEISIINLIALPTSDCN
jgi:hypothetical protein